MPGADKSDNSLVYGYGAAQTMAKVLEMCGDDLTRANVMKQAASLKDFDAGHAAAGHQDQYLAPPTSRRSQQLQMMRFKGEKWELFGDIFSADADELSSE